MPDGDVRIDRPDDCRQTQTALPSRDRGQHSSPSRPRTQLSPVASSARRRRRHAHPQVHQSQQHQQPQRRRPPPRRAPWPLNRPDTSVQTYSLTSPAAKLRPQTRSRSSSARGCPSSSRTCMPGSIVDPPLIKGPPPLPPYTSVGPPPDRTGPRSPLSRPPPSTRSSCAPDCCWSSAMAIVESIHPRASRGRPSTIAFTPS